MPVCCIPKIEPQIQKNGLVESNSIPQTILTTSRKNPPTIQTPQFLGSSTRKLLHDSDRRVLILHFQKASKSLNNNSKFPKNSWEIPQGKFGNALNIHPAPKSRSFCGSVAYLAPEILTRQGHGRTVDLYGLGVCPGQEMGGVFFSGILIVT